MRILGIDPGFAIVGYGILDYNNVNLKTVSFGAITTDKNSHFNDRISIIYDDMISLISKYKPNVMSLEKVYFTTNQKTAVNVSQARGVIILAAKKCGLDIYEYTPLQVKQSVAGYGKAEKKQVIYMTQNILNLKNSIHLDDTADALALAICHANSYKYMNRIF